MSLCLIFAFTYLYERHVGQLFSFFYLSSCLFFLCVGVGLAHIINTLKLMEHMCTWHARLIHHCTSKSVPVVMDIKPLLQWLADAWRWVLIKCWLCFLPGLIRFLINFPRWLSELRCHIKVLWALDLSEGKKRLWLILRLISHHWWCITLINCSTGFTNQHLKNIMHFRSLLLYDRWTFEWTVNSQQAAVPALHLQDSIIASCFFFEILYIFPANMGKYLIYHSEGSKYCVICAKRCLQIFVSYFNCMKYVLVVFPEGESSSEQK